MSTKFNFSLGDNYNTRITDLNDTLKALAKFDPSGASDLETGMLRFYNNKIEQYDGTTWQDYKFDTLFIDSISEQTSENGVDIDGVNIKDGGAVFNDDININKNSTPYLFLNRTDVSTNMFIAASTNDAVVGVNSGKGLLFYSNNSLTLDLDENNNAHFKEKVGIGRTPTTIFDIYTVSGNLQMLLENAGSGESNIRLKNSLGDFAWYVSTDGSLKVWNYNSSSVSLEINNSNNAIFSGNVDILNYLSLKSSNSIVPTSGKHLELYMYSGDNIARINSYDRTTSSALPLYLTASYYTFWQGDVNFKGSVGIGTDDPTSLLHLRQDSSAGVFGIILQNGLSKYGQIQLAGSSYTTTNWANSLLINTGGTEYPNIVLAANNGDVRITNSAASNLLIVKPTGNVGIGISNPQDYFSTINDLVLGGSSSHGITVKSGSTGYGYLAFSDGTSGLQSYKGIIRFNHNDEEMAFYTNDGTNQVKAMELNGDGIVSMLNQPSLRVRLSVGQSIGYGTQTTIIFNDTTSTGCFVENIDYDNTTGIITLNKGKYLISGDLRADTSSTGEVYFDIGGSNFCIISFFQLNTCFSQIIKIDSDNTDVKVRTKLSGMPEYNPGLLYADSNLNIIKIA